MQQAKQLYHLQQLDLTIISHEKRLEEINSALDDNAAVQAAQKQLVVAEEQLKPLQTAMRDLELQVEGARNKREQTEKRLYSGTVKNPKEMQDMQNEIEALKRRRSDLEDQMLEQMMAVEEATTTRDAAQTHLETVQAAAAAENADLVNERDQLHDQVATLRDQRVSAANDIAAAMLQRYEDMRPRKANQPIALLMEDETCSACGIKQLGTIAKTIRQGDELVTCKNCQRILVAD